MRNSERLQHEMDTTLEEIETFLHDLSCVDLSRDYSLRRQKLESKVKLLRAKHHLHLQRMPLSSLRVIYDPFPKDLELKRPRASTLPDNLFTFLPDVPEEEDEVSVSGSGNQKKSAKNQSRTQTHTQLDTIHDKNENIYRGMRPRSASFPISL